MKKLLILIILAVSTLSVWAQYTNLDLSQALKVGDSLINFPKAQVINYNSSTFDYTKSKGKLLLLDFFNTRCSSCIAKMPTMEKIQKEMKGQLEVVMVTYEDKATMEKFYKNNKYLKEHKCKLPTIVSDTSLIKLFPYNAVSHVVWVYDHQIKAISYPDHVTQENIQKVIKGETVEIPVKNDFEVVEIQANANVLGRTDDNLIGKVELTAYNPKLTLNGLKIDYDSITGMQTAYINNVSILGAFTSARAKIKDPSYFLIKDRYEWHVKDPEQYEYFESEANPYRLWAEKNAICYKRISRRKLPDSTWAKLVMRDIADFLQIDVSWETKSKRCLVISTTEKGEKIIPQKSVVFQESATLAFGLDFSGRFLPVIDEASFKSPLTLPAIKDLKDYKELNPYLVGYGLMIKEELRDIEVLVVKER